jgi:hypothetical protein
MLISPKFQTIRHSPKIGENDGIWHLKQAKSAVLYSKRWSRDRVANV